VKLLTKVATNLKSHSQNAKAMATDKKVNIAVDYQSLSLA
jgi:hypothetical protein